MNRLEARPERAGSVPHCIHSLLLMIAAFVLFSCSSERTPNSLPETHPDSWINSESQDFHGVVVKQVGITSCTKCHGEDLNGGKTGISCIECHLSNSACTTCHGGLDNSSGAPPYGLRNETSDTLIAVGAHTSHLEGSGLSSGYACSICHLVPSTILEPSHLDVASWSTGNPIDSVAEITWHGLADSVEAQWDRQSRRCSGTYCHGNFSGGDSANSPIWTGADQAACGSCHDTGRDPGSLGWEHQIHVEIFGRTCHDCHANVVDSSLSIITPAIQVNGVVDTMINDIARCSSCHSQTVSLCVVCHGGLDNQTGAPPYDLRGDSLTSLRSVGAHTTHMNGTQIVDPFDCWDCHIVPRHFPDSGHYGIDSVAELNFSNLAGIQAAWDTTSASCTNVYCHGNFAGGYSSNSPTWTSAGQALCGSCHAGNTNTSNLSGKHKKHVENKGLACQECHADVVDNLPFPPNIIGRDLHVNGAKDVRLSGGGTFDPTDKSCSNTGCHGRKIWK